MSAHELVVCGTPRSEAAGVRSLRVLTLTPFYPSRENPTEGCFVAEVLPWMQRQKIKSEVIAVRPFYRGKVHDVASEVPCTWKTYFALPGNVGLARAGRFLAGTLLKFLADAHREQPFDLIHAHAALPCGHAAARVSKILDIPFVVTVHGLDVFSDRQANGMLGVWCRNVCQEVYRHASAVICISEEVRQRLNGIPVNATVIHNGVDAALFSPAPERRAPLVILSVGNLIPTKGHALLLRAFADIAHEHPDCELHIIGDGPERQALMRLTQALVISSRVRFLEKQSRTAVADAMKRCAVFALPSSYEGLGGVYLEAMACAKPVIGCEGQGIADIIRHGSNGLLVPPHDELQLRNALGMLLQNAGLRARLGAAARESILQRHTLEQQATNFANLYRECVA